MQGISWKKAYGVSFIFHAIVLSIAGLFIAGTVAHQEQQQMYVVDLDASQLESAGSGHAGGGGNLFPEKLSEAQMEQKMTAAEQTPVTPTNQPPAAVSDAVPTPDSASASASGASSAAASAGQGSGAGDGGGYGGGSGTGIGEGTGDGQGYGEGAGDGQGSGYSGAEGTGTGAFDEAGLWAAINANKTYPAMAVRRGLTGSVTIQTAVEPDGSISSVSVIGSSGQSILDKAAVQAAYNVGSYPNPTGQTVYANTTVTFYLN